MISIVLIASIGYLRQLGHHGDTKIQDTAEDSQDSGQDVRVIAPNIHFTDQAGKLQQLKSYHGKVVLLSFWASWCGPCVEEMPTFATIVNKYKTQGFEMLAVNVDDDQQEAQSFIRDFWKNKSIPFPPFFDKDRSASSAFKVDALPSNFVIDRQGKIAFSGFGASDWSSPDVMQSLELLLSEH